MASILEGCVCVCGWHRSLMGGCVGGIDPRAVCVWVSSILEVCVWVASILEGCVCGWHRSLMGGRVGGIDL